MVRSTLITSVFLPGSAPRRRLNHFIETQFARINGDWDEDMDAVGKIEGAICFSQTCGLFGVTPEESRANVRKLRKELNDLLDLKFKGTRKANNHACLNED